MRRYLRVFIIVILITVYGCKAIPASNPSVISTPTLVPQTTTYPSPIQITPVNTIPENTIPFNIDKPVLEGATEITGKGTPGVPVIIYDVTFMGEVLGQGTIQSDGTFKILVPTLEKGHRIGLGIADLAGTKWKAEDFQNPGYNGDEARLIPMVGFFFDTAMVLGK
jgi:hypothetical protein